ncbi:MAG: hypothetical protein HY738_11020 [Bacteroidia bacterium]|nr:hypothetical protein [Bacteroidia bacterium]
MKKIVILIVVVWGIYTSAFSQSWIVKTVPGDYSTIQSALNAAGAYYEIRVAPGVYPENIVWPQVAPLF